MSSVVAQHMREIGVRVALGATAARVGRHVVAQAARWDWATVPITIPKRGAQPPGDGRPR
jgi:hypothetical protein